MQQKNDIVLLLAVLYRLAPVSNSSDVILNVVTVGSCGEITTLACQVISISPLDCNETSCVWYKNNSFLWKYGFQNVSDNKKYETNFTDFNLWLMIDNTSVSDSGNYKCRYGSKSSNYVNLSIKCIYTTGPARTGIYTTGPARTGIYTTGPTRTVEPESVLLSPTHISYVLYEGEFLGTITCSAKCRPNCTYMWTKDNVHDSRTLIISNNGNLTLGLVQKGSKGRYTCTASKSAVGNVSTDITASVDIDVLYKPDLPVLLPNVDSYTLKVGSGMPPIQCSANCNPNCTYYWTKDYLNHNVSQDETLQLGTLEKNEEGRYHCIATNVVGHSTMSMAVNVFVNVDSENIKPYDKMDNIIWNICLAVAGVVVCLVIVSCAVFYMRKDHSRRRSKEISNSKMERQTECDNVQYVSSGNVDYLTPVDPYVYDEIQ